MRYLIFINTILDPPKPAHRPGIGLVFMFFSTVFFSTMSILVKLMGPELPSFQLVFARSFIQGIAVFIVLVSLKISPWGQVKFFPSFHLKFAKRQHRLYFLARGVAGFVSLSCFYYSLIHLPLNEATVLSFTSPIFTAIWGVVILKEKWEKIDIFGAILRLQFVVFLH
jgi:drug/metabolite transporter (DMT)-like permease